MEVSAMRFYAVSLMRAGSVVALMVTLPILIGCTSSSSPSKPLGKPVPVKGKVTYNGKAAAGCTITFFHSERNFPASAVIAADGTYTLLFNGKPEVPTGTYKVAVAPPAGAEADTAVADPSNPEAYKAFMLKTKISKAVVAKTTIPKKYAVPETSKVTFTVVEQPTTYDLDMKD
jgi:hypothetical protein